MVDVAPPAGVARVIATEFHPQGVAFGRDASGGSILDEMKRGDVRIPAVLPVAGVGAGGGGCPAPGMSGGAAC